MGLNIIHDNFTMKVPAQRGPMWIVAFKDEDTNQEDAFIFSDEAFKEWAEAISRARTGLVEASPADVAAMRRQK